MVASRNSDCIVIPLDDPLTASNRKVDLIMASHDEVSERRFELPL